MPLDHPDIRQDPASRHDPAFWQDGDNAIIEGLVQAKRTPIVFESIRQQGNRKVIAVTVARTPPEALGLLIA
jgi:hypothetical protein